MLNAAGDKARLDWEVHIGLSKAEATSDFTRAFAKDVLLAGLRVSEK